MPLGHAWPASHDMSMYLGLLLLGPSPMLLLTSLSLSKSSMRSAAQQLAVWTPTRAPIRILFPEKEHGGNRPVYTSAEEIHGGS